MKEEKRNIPEVRFREFAGDNADAWEQRKLGEIYGKIGNAFVGTATPFYVDKENGHFYLESNNVKDGHINRNNEIFINDEFYKKQQNKWLHTGDIVMVQSGHVGHSAVIPKELNNIAAHALIMFRYPVEKVEPNFINYQFQTIQSKKKIENITTGNTIKHILASDLRNFSVSTPVYSEQEKVGNFLQHFDTLIALHQRKLDNLKVLKKTLLSKMFPKNDEKYPEIRFSGFTDAWELRKLGEVVDFLNGRAYKQTELLDIGKYPVVRVGNFNTNDRWYYSNLELDNSKYIDNGDLVYLWATNFGPKIWTGNKAIYHYHIWKISNISTNIYKHYLYTWLEKDKERIKLTTNGTTMVHVTKGNMENRAFEFPIFEEQQKIGNFFKHLDELITLHQRELDDLKVLKKTLLSKMFV